ncbi:hypothetical protein LSH36_961g00070 [Paralvinella palmiformis]|uniref:Glycosyltransferase n=1 Tax=Paralvinella palmiformis TaxID=53620 RepID=A0AAD9IYH0_9ANNE|nr:hypothetical protein LSH36_961g00070 [Paralvinella palmiformis]
MSDDVIKPKNVDTPVIRRRVLRVLVVLAGGFVVFHVLYFLSGKTAGFMSKRSTETDGASLSSSSSSGSHSSGYGVQSAQDEEFEKCVTTVSNKIMKLWEDQAEYQIKNESDPCGELWKSIEMERKVIIDFFEQETPWNQTAVTLVTQTSYGRIDHLLASIKMWDGPVSVAVYVKDDNVEEIVSKICNTKEFFTRKDIGLHFAPVQGKYYPYNYLRNMALNNSRTSHVFLLDVDFNPMPGLHGKLVDYIKRGTPSEKEVLVIPAFEWSPISMLQQPAFPRNKEELMELWEQEYLFPFRFNFIIPNDIFILHSPHPKMIDKGERQVLYACAAPVYEEFKSHIRNTYGVELQD